MSITAAINSRVIMRRAEEALKTSAEFNCIPSSGLMQAPRFWPDAASFQEQNGDVEFVLRLTGRALVWIFPLELALYVIVKLTAESAGERGLRPELGFEYSRFELMTVDGEGSEDPFDMDDSQRDALDDQMRDVVKNSLAGLAVPLDVSSLVTEDREISTNPVLTIGETGDDGSSDTLSIGLEVEGDDDTDRTFFRNSYVRSSLGNRDWLVDVDAALFTETVQHHLDELELEDEVPNWADTDEVTAFWSGATVPEPDYGQTDAIEAISDQHPVWVIVEGDYTVFSGWGEVLGEVEFGSWAVVFADLAVADGAIVAQPGIFSAGYGVFRINVSDVEIPSTVIRDSADFDNGLRLAGFAFDEDRLTLLGVDDHAGMPGAPKIVPPAEVRAIFEWNEIGEGMCTGNLAVGQLTSDGAVLSRPEFGNAGSSPVWVCEATIDDDDDGVFSVIGPEFPLRIDPGQPKRLDVAMAVADGDDHEYTATLRLRTNQMDEPFVDVPVFGHREPYPAATGPQTQVCLREPDLIPPQDWFDAILGTLADPRDVLVDQPEPHDVVVAVFVGLPSQAILVATDPSGVEVDIGLSSGSHHTSVIPATGAQMELRGAGRSGAGRFAGAWLRTARRQPISDWSTDEDVVGFAATAEHVAVLTPSRLALIPRSGGAATEIPLEGGRDVVGSGQSTYVVTEAEVIAVDPGLRTHRAKAPGIERLLSTSNGVIGFGEQGVVAVEQARDGLAVTSRELAGPVQGAVPVSDGLAVVGDRSAIVMKSPGGRGLADAREVDPRDLDQHVGDWLKAGAPDVARQSAERDLSVIELARGRRGVAALGPSRLRLRPPS